MQNIPATILFFGRPGAGKSTQAARIAEYLRNRRTNPVEFIRWAEVRDSFTHAHPAASAALATLYAQGALQPKFLSISMWGPYLLDRVASSTELVIEGMPRQTFEAEALDSALTFLGRKDMLIISLDIQPATAEKRLKERAETEGRPDDTAEAAIQQRLSWFETDTLPALQFLRNTGNYRIINMDADRSLETIQKDIEELLND